MTLRSIIERGERLSFECDNAGDWLSLIRSLSPKRGACSDKYEPSSDFNASSRRARRLVRLHLGQYRSGQPNLRLKPAPGT
jgi:hypothetical protein